MTVSLPYFSPGLTTYLMIRTVIAEPGIPWEPRRLASYGALDNPRAAMGYYRPAGVLVRSIW